LGLSGPDLAAARAALEAQHRAESAQPAPTPQLRAWLASLREPKLEAYALALARLGVREGGLELSARAPRQPKKKKRDRYPRIAGAFWRGGSLLLLLLLLLLTSVSTGAPPP
jgi:hypothetical protein